MVTAHLLAVYVMVWVVGHVMGCGSFFDIVLKSFTPTGADMRPVFFRAPLEISNFSNTHPLT